jgi:hypothetical protein
MDGDTENDLDHPLFTNSVPADLSKAHPAFLALVHLSSSDSDSDLPNSPKVFASGPIRRIHRRKKTITQKTPYDRDMKELEFVLKHHKMLEKGKK